MNSIKKRSNGYRLESVPPEPDKISKKIKKLLNDPNKMKEISERNLKDAKEKYDVEAVSEEIKDIYENISK